MKVKIFSSKKLPRIAKCLKSDLLKSKNPILRHMTKDGGSRWKYLTESQVSQIKLLGKGYINIFYLDKPIIFDNSESLYFREMYKGAPIDDWKNTCNKSMINLVKSNPDKYEWTYYEEETER